jgi:hypothetical protein
MSAAHNQSQLEEAVSVAVVVVAAVVAAAVVEVEVAVVVAVHQDSTLVYLEWVVGTCPNSFLMCLYPYS